MKRFVPDIFLGFVILSLLFLIRPAFLGQLNGTFKINNEPQDYKKLEVYLSSQYNFFRTIWLPTIQRFAYYSNSHPALTAQGYFNKQDTKDLISSLKSKNAEKLLQEAGVKFVIIPYDSQGEIFLKDWKYDNKMYLQAIKDLSSLKWLSRINKFDRIGVFQVADSKGHFWTNSSTLSLSYSFRSPVEYRLSLRNARVGDVIIFAENYDAKWFARDTKTSIFDWPNLISSDPYDRIFNSFTLRKSGNYSLAIYYYPQVFVNIGVAVSLISLILVLGTIFYLRKKI